MTEATTAQDCTRYSATIRDVKFGSGVRVVEPCNIYECEIGSESFVGPFTELQKCKVGERTRIQSHSFICELVTIGNDCFVGHGVMFVNDLFQNGKPSFDSDDWKPTIIGNNVSIGSNATILPVTICESVVIGAGAVVTKDNTEPGFYAGNPARKIRDMQ